MRWKLCGNKSEWQKRGQNCRERSGETETWQPTKKKKRNGYQNRETEGTWMEVIERKATTGKKRRKVNLRTQHEDRRRMAGREQSKMKIVD